MELNLNLRRKTLERILGDQAIYSEDEITFRCPFCGDSQKDLNKKRGGYNLDKDLYHCFNCSIGFPNAFTVVVQKLTGKNVIDIMASILKGEELLMVKKQPVLKHHNEKVVPKDFNDFLDLECVLITKETKDHPPSAWNFLEERKLDKVGRTFYYCYDHESRFYGRVIIPFFDEKGDCIYFQARALVDTDIKFKYLNPHGTKDVVFGLDKVDRTKIVPVLEGPLDAMFVENAVAIMSSAPSNRQMELLKGLNLVFMLDNDAAGLKSMKKLAKKGQKVVLWSSNFNWGEDINDYVKRTGLTRLNLSSFVEPMILHPFQAEVLLTIKLKEKGLL